MPAWVFALFALFAFAANSVLCRIALGTRAIDPATYSTVRLAAGAAVLALPTLTVRRRGRAVGDWASAAMLFLYAVAFSFAYVTLSAGTGALILFGSVQATMLSAAVLGGERPELRQWGGLLLALAGLGYLVWPGLAAPPLAGAALMALAGIAWAIYTLRGRRSGSPVASTGANFALALPLTAGVSLAAAAGAHASLRGILLAVISGAVASGAGYAAWYAALPRLSTTRASIVQLAVPVLAAGAGVVWLAEAVTLRLLVSSVAVLGGVAIGVSGKK